MCNSPIILLLSSIDSYYFFMGFFSLWSSKVFIFSFICESYFCSFWNLKSLMLIYGSTIDTFLFLASSSDRFGLGESKPLWFSFSPIACFETLLMKLVAIFNRFIMLSVLTKLKILDNRLLLLFSPAVALSGLWCRCSCGCSWGSLPVGDFSFSPSMFLEAYFNLLNEGFGATLSIFSLVSDFLSKLPNFKAPEAFAILEEALLSAWCSGGDTYLPASDCWLWDRRCWYFRPSAISFTKPLLLPIFIFIKIS